MDRAGGNPIYDVPSFIWDYVPDQRLDFRIVGKATVGGRRTSILSLYGPEGVVAPYWFLLWVDHEGLVVRAEMRGPGHFMEQRYGSFNSTLRVEPPTIPSER